MNALFYLYSTTSAERIAIFEDDIAACSGLREYLDRQPLPEHRYWNLLTHDENLLERRSVDSGWFESNQLGRGACGLVFDRKGVDELLRAAHFVRAPADNRTMADAVVIETFRALGYRELVHYPSLLQHTGYKSTLNNHYGSVSSFCSECPKPNDISSTEQPTIDADSCDFVMAGNYWRCTKCGIRVSIFDFPKSHGIFRRKCKVVEASLKVDSAREALKLGDRVEALLSSIGITQQRYKEVKELFGLPPTCNCGKRKEWLNRVSDWWRGRQE